MLNVIAGGWQLSSIVHWQSGIPFSITAPRGTFNRGGRSANNMAVTTATRDEIQALIGIFKQPDGRVFFIDPKVIDPATGRGVGADTLNNAAGFPGQIFFNPAAGELGTLQRLSLDAPVDLPDGPEPEQAAADRQPLLGGVQDRGVQPVQLADLRFRGHGHQQHDVRPRHAARAERDGVARAAARA